MLFFYLTLSLSLFIISFYDEFHLQKDILALITMEPDLFDKEREEQFRHLIQDFGALTVFLDPCSFIWCRVLSTSINSGYNTHRALTSANYSELHEFCSLKVQVKLELFDTWAIIFKTRKSLSSYQVFCQHTTQPACCCTTPRIKKSKNSMIQIIINQSVLK